MFCKPCMREEDNPIADTHTWLDDQPLRQGKPRSPFSINSALACPEYHSPTLHPGQAVCSHSASATGCCSWLSVLALASLSWQSEAAHMIKQLRGSPSAEVAYVIPAGAQLAFGKNQEAFTVEYQEGSASDPMADMLLQGWSQRASEDVQRQLRDSQ